MPLDIGNTGSVIYSKVKSVNLSRRRGSAQLGFSIRGGREHGVGIYVSDVEPGSEAQYNGLKVRITHTVN